MTPPQLFDPFSALLVVGGTLAATLLRNGWRDCRITVHLVGQLLTHPFDSVQVRAELAVQIREIGEFGLMRAEPHHFDDGEFDALSDSLARQRSVEALHVEHDKHRAHRASLAGAATRVLNEAADLAPVLGLAGTLLALGGLSNGIGDGGYGRAIASAVTTTLYGLIAANFLFAPLGAAVDRRALGEERDRQELLDWLALAIERIAPGRTGAVSKLKRTAA